MVDLSQAREIIWQAIERAEGATEVAKRAGISPSMLYKFKTGEKLLGPASVNRLAPVLTSIDTETWAAAMGVNLPESVEASA